MLVEWDKHPPQPHCCAYEAFPQKNFPLCAEPPSSPVGILHVQQRRAARSVTSKVSAFLRQKQTYPLRDISFSADTPRALTGVR